MQTRRGESLWTPSEEAIERSNMTQYMRWLETVHGVEAGGDYHELWRWSVTEIEEFWASIWSYFGVRASRPYDQVLAERTMPGARWFTNAELNFTEHVLAGKPPERTAVLHASELRELDEISWTNLTEEVARVAGGLRELGVERGDRVAAYMPNIPEALIALLATASIGAIWSSCSPDFGPGSVIDRFSQIEPKVLFCVDGYSYGGRPFDRTGALERILAELPTIERTIVLPYLDQQPDTSKLRNALTWGELAASGRDVPFHYERVPFDHPLWVLYSSGTTGLPKAIVHGHGGILLELLKKLHLHNDAHEGDRLFWFTTTGWMMWNFLIGGLLTEAAIILYDGSPGYPDMNVLWDLAEHSEMTMFGTSASYIAACMKAGIEPGAGRDLSRLGAIGSTGSPLAPEGFQWVYDHVGADTWLFSTSGGTDVCTSFVGAVPIVPVYRGELQGRSLGAAVEAWNEDGEPVIDEVGELVITEPLPSMPLFLWGDEDGSRYRDAYFEMFPGAWRHGDWIEITSRNTAVIYGRSDATINRQGVRMGTSEIYRAVQRVDKVVDAVVVDIPKPGTEGWMPLFVVLRDGAELDDALVAEINREIREQCSPRHVPDAVYRVDQVPRTLSGKTLEVPVKRILTGTPPERAASKDSLANPDSLDFFVELASELDASSSSS